MIPLPHPSAVIQPRIIKRFDRDNLYPHLPGHRLNASLIAWRGGFRMAYRSGWKGSDIFLVKLDANLRPRGVSRLAIEHDDCSYAREDPRLFVHRGKLHVSICGVVRGRGRALHTNVLCARLDKRETVEAVYHPRYEHRTHWEKNWGFFSHAGQLYASYTVAPHRVLKIDGDRAELVHHTPAPFRWTGGELRGGASPVLHRGQFYSFVHGRWDDVPHVYHAGLVTFEAKPPFAVTRCVPWPIWTADSMTRPHRGRPSVVFPSGAVLRNRRWLVSAGIHDRSIEIGEYNAAELEGLLGKRFDAGVVYRRDICEWHVPERFEPNNNAVVIGAIGPAPSATLLSSRGIVTTIAAGEAGPAMPITRREGQTTEATGYTLDKLLAKAGPNVAYLWLGCTDPWSTIAGSVDVSRVGRIVVPFDWRESSGDLASMIAGRGFNVRVVRTLADRGCVIGDRDATQDNTP